MKNIDNEKTTQIDEKDQEIVSENPQEPEKDQAITPETEIAKEPEQHEDVLTDMDDAVAAQADAEPSSEAVQGTSQETDLPEGVTAEPQEPEHMDLRKVPADKKWVRSYLTVSDDEGHLLGDTGLEKRVKNLCADLAEMDLTKEEDAQLWVDRIKEVVTEYASAINFRENTTVGTFT